MGSDEYWTGQGIDLDGLWRDFDAGRAYEAETARVPLHLIRLTFDGHPPDLPLFDHEVIYKTIKGTYYDVKEACFPPDVFAKLRPIFLRQIVRGSGIFEFLAQLDPALTWVVALGSASMWYRSALSKDQEIDEKKLAFLRNEFPMASDADAKVYLKAWTTFGRRKVLYRLIDQGLRRVEISKSPLSLMANPEMVDLDRILALQTGDKRR